MKIIRFLIAFIFLASSTFLSAQANPVLKGCIANLPDSVTSVKIAYLRGKDLAVKQAVPVSTATGCFEAEWTQKERGIFVLYIDGMHTFDLVISEGLLEISADYDALNEAQLKGPGINEFQTFKSLVAPTTGAPPSEEDVRTFLLGIKDDALRDFLMPQLIPLNPDTNVFWLRSHFWDYTNLNSISTFINPFFEKNRTLYFDQVLGHNPDTVIYHLERLLSQPLNEQIRKVLISTATYHYETSKFMGEDEVFVWLVNHFYVNGYADWISKNDLGKIREKAEGLSTELIGQPAPDFAFDTQNNGRMKLSEVQSPITILYFWDSECGHCRKETPRLKELYDDYKDKGVEVVAITLQNEFTGWEKYIEEHDLDWINGFESNFDRPNFLWYYYIPTTPKKLVLGADKTIVAKNLDVETTLRTFIDDYLAGKVK
ncbi:peroxiredoxin family protein [Schleiferiaceae bacterium]|nr:peroxiredoxin family protein [Schleiferiaceae bacterium]MDC3217482.1 peroxiredoxin family protein [Schleiferiaceae bacterium]